MKKSLFLIVLMVCMAIGASAQKTYVLLAGVSRYSNEQANLGYTSKDVKELKEIFKKQGCVVTTLTSKYVVRQHISEKLAAIAKLAKPEDKIIFCYSGHGSTGGMVLYDLSLFTYHELVNMLTQSKARQIICCIDACHSGSVTSDVQGSYTWSDEAGSHGISFIMGCRAEELSYENGWLGNGMLVQALKKGLRGMADANGDKAVTLIELFNYVYNDVTAHTFNSDQVQHPQLIGPGSAHNTVITRW